VGHPGDHAGMGILQNPEKQCVGPSCWNIFASMLVRCVVVFFLQCQINQAFANFLVSEESMRATLKAI
jgi:hypothetical protein